MRFNNLSHDGQVALAGLALLIKSQPDEPLEPDELSGLGCRYNRALGEICTTVGLRTRIRHNNQRRADVNPRAIRKQLRPTKKKKVTAP